MKHSPEALDVAEILRLDNQHFFMSPLRRSKWTVYICFIFWCKQNYVNDAEIVMELIESL